MIGFTMYGMIQEPAYTRLWFDRLLIDKQHQGKGYAKPAAQLIPQEIRTHYPNTDIYLSVYAENHSAIALYRSFGFEFTGELDTKGEEIMIYRNDYTLSDLDKAFISELCNVKREIFKDFAL